MLDSSMRNSKHAPLNVALVVKALVMAENVVMEIVLQIATILMVVATEDIAILQLRTHQEVL